MLKIQLVEGHLVVPLDSLVETLHGEVKKLRDDNHPIIANHLDDLTREIVNNALKGA